MVCGYYFMTIILGQPLCGSSGLSPKATFAAIRPVYWNRPILSLNASFRRASALQSNGWQILVNGWSQTTPGVIVDDKYRSINHLLRASSSSIPQGRRLRTDTACCQTDCCEVNHTVTWVNGTRKRPVLSIIAFVILMIPILRLPYCHCDRPYQWHIILIGYYAP